LIAGNGAGTSAEGLAATSGDASTVFFSVPGSAEANGVFTGTAEGLTSALALPTGRAAGWHFELSDADFESDEGVALSGIGFLVATLFVATSGFA
jgi:hypothetical protein